MRADRLVMRRKATLALGALAGGIAYYAVAHVSLAARNLLPSISPIWPAAGIGLASALTWDCAPTCPLVFLASLGIAWTLRLPALAALGMAVANAGEVLVAGQLLNRTRLNGYSFFQPRDFALYSMITLASCAGASALAVAAFRQVGLLGPVSYAFALLTRVLAHWTGMLLVSPLLLLWRYHPRLSWRPAYSAEGLAMAAATGAACWFLFSGATEVSRAHTPLSYLLMPLALWPAVRHGLRETATTLIFITAAALWGTIHELGPFAAMSPSADVTLMQGFLAVQAVVCMSLASAVWRAKDNGRELAQARWRLRLVLDASPVYIGYVGRDGRYAMVNHAFEDWFGSPAERLVGRRADETLGSAFPAFAQLQRRAFAGETVHETIETLDPQGSTRWLDVHYLPDRENGRVRGYVITTVDVTALKKSEAALRSAEARLRSLNRELERRVEQRTARLRQVNAELESFAYSVAHDLRSPLRKMSGFSEAVLEDYEDRLDPRGADYLHRIFDASRRMARLIDDMLDLSQVTRSETRDEMVDLSEAARRMLDDLRRDEPGREVEVVVAPGLRDHGDPRLLVTALRHLLDNAWKFTRPKARARIEVGLIPQEPAPVFFVRDTGVGFEMSQTGKLFTAFESLHAREEFPGTGIGLATVQRVVQRHGGRVWAEGEPGKGATFYFTLHEKPS